jgi:alpha-aminoadipate/glutamate carrier protein LysW
MRRSEGSAAQKSNCTYKEGKAMEVTCPECGAEWELSGVEQGEIVTCPDCGVDLEVLTADPITVGLAPEEGEDWGE